MTTGLVIERGDPRTPEAKALLEASHALMQELFMPDANHFLSLDALAAPDIAFFVARLDGRAVGCGALTFSRGCGGRFRKRGWLPRLFPGPSVGWRIHRTPGGPGPCSW